MPTIVKYTDQQPSVNRYPQQIISPLQAGACCFSDMEVLGPPQTDARWAYQYRRCRQCGYTVRVILHEIPDAALVAGLRETLAHVFTRDVPDGHLGASKAPKGARTRADSEGERWRTRRRHARCTSAT